MCEIKTAAEVVIVGGGPGGCASALFLLQRGIRPIIVEKETFPRYHIGESLTGECGNALRALGLAEQMQQHRFPVKGGVTVFGSSGESSFHVPVKRRSSMGELVDSTTWQVRRSEFDKLLLDEALARGARLICGQVLEPIREDDAVVGVRVRTPEGSVDNVASEVLVDASGMATFLSNAGVIPAKSRGNYDRQLAIFSQVSGARRDEGKDRNNTLIFYQQKNHWAWFIPLDDEVTSVGIVVPSPYFKSKRESKREFLLRELQELNPELSKRMQGAELVEEIRAVSNYSYEVKEFSGRGYLCVGDAHRFIDPIFSFGINFAVREAEFAAMAIENYLNGQVTDAANPFIDYQRLCDRGQDAIQALVDAFWNHPFSFAFFVHHRYAEDFVDLFAGRIYTETPSRGLAAIHAVNARGFGRGSGLRYRS